MSEASTAPWQPGLVPFVPAVELVPPPATTEPEGFLVVVGEHDRIHFLDWGGPPGADPGILLIHGLLATAWSWAPVARRLCPSRHVVAVDLRGHGLSDAPIEGYDPVTLADDLEAVAEGSGLLAMGPGAGGPDDRVVLVGHGFGAIVATWLATRLRERCAALVLVDGGWEDVGAETGLDVAELLGALEEPPEIVRSMATYLADRAAYDPASWDRDQERAARAAVVELPVGRVEPAVHPHVREGMVQAMLRYRPVSTLAAVRAPIVALAAADDESGTHQASLGRAAAALAAAGRPAIRVARFADAGHNLMRYRPVEVAAAVLAAGTTEEPT